MEMVKRTLESLVGRDELTISESPNDEDIIGALVIDVQKSNVRGQDCLYVHQVRHFQLLFWSHCALHVKVKAFVPNSKTNIGHFLPFLHSYFSHAVSGVGVCDCVMINVSLCLSYST